MRLLIPILMLAVAAFSQPTSPTTYEFVVSQSGYYPPSFEVTYSGTFVSATSGTGTGYACTVDSSETGRLYWRIRDYQSQTTKPNPGTYTSGCVGAGFTIGSTFHPVTLTMRVVPDAFYSISYLTASPETAPAICNGALLNQVRFFGLDVSCLDPQRTPGGTRPIPGVGGSYVDPMGPTIRAIASDTNQYASISPFNRDSTMVLGQNGIYRVSDGVRLYTYRPDNINSAQCWLELVPGWENVMHCYDSNIPWYGGQGRIIRYTLPNLATCGTLPCAITDWTEIYRANGTDSSGNAYNFLSKGGSSGASIDGWNVWMEARLPFESYVRQGDWKLCIARLTTTETIAPICLNNASTAGTDGSDFLNLAKATDADGRRRIFNMSADPYMVVASWAPGETTLRIDGGMRNTDNFADPKYRDTCVAVANTDWCVKTPHSDLVQINEHSHLMGDGTYSEAGVNAILARRGSSNGPGLTGKKDSMRWSDAGGGARIGAHAGMYAGCAVYSSICVATNFSGYAALSGRSPMYWNPGTCTAGSCTATMAAAHGMTTGQQIQIAANNMGITEGSVYTITSHTTTTYTLTIPGLTATGVAWAQPYQQVGTAAYDLMSLVRHFAWGAQRIGMPGHRTMSTDFQDFPKPAVSPCGDKVAWGSNFGLPFVGRLLLLETGLGCPTRDEQLDGPATTVSAIPGTGSLTLRFITPANATSCTAQASTTPDLASAATGSANSGSWREIVLSGLTSNVPYYWRVACQRAPSGLIPGGINEARGIAVTR